MPSKYSIVIPTYNHLEDCLKPCIKSIIENTNLEEVEIIIVANGCTDETKEYVKSLDKQYFKGLWSEEPLGCVKAINCGIKQAKGEYVVLLNNDTEILNYMAPSEWLRLLERPFIEDDKMAVTGPLYGNEKIAGYGFIIFFCAMIPQRIFEEIGLLDEEFSPGGGDDVDFCIRVQKVGYKIRQTPENQKTSIYDTIFPIYHKPDTTVRELPNWGETFTNNMNKVRQRYQT